MAGRKRGWRAARRCLPPAVFSLLGWLLLALLRGAVNPGPGLWYLMEAVGLGAFVALPAWAGLTSPGGAGAGSLPLGRVTPAHVFSALVCGALFAAPASLLRDLAAAVTGYAGVPPEPPGAGFVFALALGALAVPACHAVFYRGYLEGALRAFGRAAFVLPAALFALSGGCAADMLPRFSLGLMLSAIARRHASLIPSAAAHGAFLCTGLFASALLPDALVSGRGLAAALLRVLLSFAWYLSFRKTYAMDAAAGRFEPRELLRLSAKDRAVLAAAAALTLASGIWGVLE